MSTRTPSQRIAHTHMQARRRRLKALGQWQPYVDAEPVRQHLRKVNAAGMPYRAINERLRLPHESSLQYLMWGKGKWGPGQKVRRETAELVLAYWPTLDDFPDLALIDATGTRRRVEALAVQGWSRNWVGEQVGIRPEHFRKAVKRDRVEARLARAVVAVYDRWWDQDPLEHGVRRNPVARVKADAARAGFHSALAWDDDTIDDPNAAPMTDASEPVATEGGNVAARWLMGESVILDREARREVLQYLFEWTTNSTEEIAARLDMTPEAAERQWHRLQVKAAGEGRRLWRRTWAYCDKELTKKSMGEAA
ncbi:hypothetical protein SUDANB145_07281 (plasmid) [Streptomyces sp. enrichment culture]|uniref:hypothetical protein n=1 Tax=Streptomyces sp. enrichment culture TaxID=1795815 RepID=UPI003F56E1E3